MHGDQTTRTKRCSWCGEHADYQAYHDEEWGVPLTEEQRLFEFLTLEGAQAGLSWLTILRKREGYRRVFEGFDRERLARWGPAQLAEAQASTGIVRNRLKIKAVVTNARATIELAERGPGLSQFLWGFVDGAPRQNQWHRHEDIPAETPLSRQLSRELKQRGFTFVGPTICYAFMQAVGMVNDHLVGCFRHEPCARLGQRFTLPERDPS
ncbi:DNA-3-methyladenine glycosylase I [Pseudohaliea rubra]|uniref:DNA-3-methyladenine glycosylase I n=1 Tax=Pseudohaliea rubra DSM 19751 TaxID=1265313 RepID=A0A095X1M4_9GAMM|nr:DNA-3-methyladenine glycosylase I [Pseudohaliea rubra]KGE04769.1 DNA-3-methyladenine glycosylase [Pseudohaliea rubra DSM 19751]